MPHVDAGTRVLWTEPVAHLQRNHLGSSWRSGGLHGGALELHVVTDFAHFELASLLATSKKRATDPGTAIAWKERSGVRRALLVVGEIELRMIITCQPDVDVANIFQDYVGYVLRMRLREGGRAHHKDPQAVHRETHGRRCGVQVPCSRRPTGRKLTWS